MAHVLRTALTKLMGSATESADDKDNDSPNTSESGPNSLTQATEKKDGVDVDASIAAASTEDGADATGEKVEGNNEEKTPEVTSSEDKSPNEEDQNKNYLTGTRLASLTFGLALATFVVALDNTIIATAIPRITTQFDSLNVSTFSMKS